MECGNCKNAITPGMEIVVDDLSREREHCPHCLEILSTESTSSEQEKSCLSAMRDEMRRKAREEFVNRLLRTSPDGNLRCPLCEHQLNKNDEIQIRNCQYFRCHLCGHDLATVAYKQEVYHEQRWLPVIFALQNHLTEESCADCCYAGAVAKACQKAYSWMPKVRFRHRAQLTSMARSPYQRIPECKLESCTLVAQYRTLAGEGLLLL